MATRSCSPAARAHLEKNHCPLTEYSDLKPKGKRKAISLVECVWQQHPSLINKIKPDALLPLEMGPIEDRVDFKHVQFGYSPEKIVINDFSFYAEPGQRIAILGNIGHMEFRGCFRCHAGDHKDDSGKVLTQECHTCHDFLVPPADGSYSLVRRNTFVHPVELEGLHAALRCDECHGGGLTPEPSCGGCHHEVAALRQGTTAALQRFGIEADVMNDVVDCANCHDLSRRVSAEWVQTQCSACHSEDEYRGMVKRWEGEVKELLAAVRSDSPHVRAAVDLLVRSGPG